MFFVSQVALAAAQFPDSFEIVEMIFMHLPGELNGLKEVCKWFNHVIINSVPLMKRVTLNWHRPSDQFLSLSPTKRIFCKVNFFNNREDVLNLLDFFHRYHSTLSKIIYNGCDLKATEFHEILSLVPGSIEDFHCVSKLECNAELPRVVLPKLSSLTLGSPSAGFFTFTGTDSMAFMPKLKFFEYYEELEEPSDETKEVMMKFLRSAKLLEVLTARDSLARRLLTEVSSAPFKFHLKRLTLEMYGFSHVKDDINVANMRELLTPDLPILLRSQQNTLTHLTIGNALLHASDFDAMLRLKIKHLEVNFCWIVWEVGPDIEPENLSIEKFTFKQLRYAAYYNEENQRQAINRVFSCCRRLRSIELHNVSLSLSCTMNMSQTKALTDLQFHCCRDLWSLHFPSLETLTVAKEPRRVPPKKEVDEVSQLILMNPQLQKIIMPMSFSGDNFFVTISSDFNVEYN